MGKFLLIIALPILIGTGMLITFNLSSEIVIPEEKNTDINYTIDNNMSEYSSDYSERGVYYDTLDRPDAPHFYTIVMGKKSTGGYSINIENVDIDAQGNVEVTVNEIEPDIGSIVTQAFTNPTCSITLDKLPKSFVVKNTEGELFKNINF